MKPTRRHFGVYGYAEKDGKVLLIKKARGPYTGRYDLPGGSPEAGETPTETLMREVKEETGLSAKPLSEGHFVECYFTDYTEEDGNAGCLYHQGLIFEIELFGTLNEKGDGIDSNGGIWLEKSLIRKENATPFVLQLLKK